MYPPSRQPRLFNEPQKMRTVGYRSQPPITATASAQLLVEGCRFNDELHRLPTGNTSFIPKGVYRFMTHADANRHALRCVAKGMARVASGTI